MLKKIVLAAVAASVATTPVLAAPGFGHDNRGRVENNHRDNDRRDNDRRPGFDRRDDNRGRQVQYRNFRKGERFDSRYARNYRVVSNYRNYHLKAPPRGYRWVQSGNDAVLIGITSGLVAAVMANMIR